MIKYYLSGSQMPISSVNSRVMNTFIFEIVRFRSCYLVYITTEQNDIIGQLRQLLAVSRSMSFQMICDHFSEVMNMIRAERASLKAPTPL